MEENLSLLLLRNEKVDELIHCDACVKAAPVNP